METTYTYYLTVRFGGESVTRGINGTEAAYAAYRKACELVEVLDGGEDAWVDLWWGETGEIVASFPDWEDDFDCDEEVWNYLKNWTESWEGKEDIIFDD